MAQDPSPQEADDPGDDPSKPGAESPEAAPEDPIPAEAGPTPTGSVAPGSTPPPRKKTKKELKAEEDCESTPHADEPMPSVDELRAAMTWAFEKEEAPEEFLDRCAEHAHLVQLANRKMNLTKILDPREIAAKHYLDAWRTTRLLPLLGRSVLDLGSGAGYPGVPIAFAEPNARVVLLDSIQKKAAFLAETCESLKIPNATAVCDRAEEHLARNRYDVVVVRAVSSVRENVRLLRKVRHSLADYIMMKGPSWSREVRAGEREAERLGFRLDTVWEHELPGEFGGRAVLVYRAPGGQGF
ncbi:MAG: 16S rRNA (guanine527-N7)-methyltransferase [Planctomycetota bacterium]|jgi:16S rRNA (guanine527-N7)-methyltransferase